MTKPSSPLGAIPHGNRAGTPFSGVAERLCYQGGAHVGTAAAKERDQQDRRGAGNGEPEMSSASEFELRFVELADRLRRYQSSTISAEISPYDDMFVPSQADANEHYVRVGREAIEIICSAMAIARKSRVTVPRSSVRRWSSNPPLGGFLPGSCCLCL